MTLPSLTIEGFRAFRRLEVPRLARVSLVVGSNNVGKTSLLEALELLAAGPAFPFVLGKILRDRREFPTERGSTRDVDVLRIFHEASRQLEIVGGTRRFSMSRAWAVPDDKGEHLLPNRAGRFRIAAEATSAPWDGVEVLDVHVNGAPPVPLTLDASLALPSGWIEQAEHATLAATSLPAGGLDEEASARLWDSVVLQGEEELLVDALRVIAPDIGRVFFINARGDSRVAYVRRTGHRNAEPLYSLGGGMRRLLDLALGLVEARGGLLLVDEIENGIHYSVQPDLWALVLEAATRLDVQVFATTHSWDCIEAFQQAAAAHPATGELIRLHRMGADIHATIADEADLAIITREAIEVR